MISSQLTKDLINLQININKTSKEITRGGYKDTTENLFHKLKNQNFQAIKNMELKGIQNAETKYQHIDTVFNDMTTELDKFKTLMINKINGSINNNGSIALDDSMNAVIDTMSHFLDTEVNGTKLFYKKTELLIGDNLRVPRTFDRSYVQLNNQEITAVMQDLVQNPDLDKFEEVFNLVNQRHAEVGARWNGVKSMKSIYENEQLTENNFMSKRYKLEESVQELNNLSMSYEALTKTIAKISALSLVNYV